MDITFPFLNSERQHQQHKTMMYLFFRCQTDRIFNTECPRKTLKPAHTREESISYTYINLCAFVRHVGPYFRFPSSCFGVFVREPGRENIYEKIKLKGRRKERSSAGQCGWFGDDGQFGAIFFFHLLSQVCKNLFIFINNFWICSGCLSGRGANNVCRAHNSRPINTFWYALSAFEIY